MHAEHSSAPALGSQAAYYDVAERNLPGAGLGGYALPENVRFVIASAHGARLVSVDGREYIDFVGGAGANILGANHPAVVRVMTPPITNWRGVETGWMRPAPGFPG